MKKSQILAGVSIAAFLGPFTQTVYTPSLPELRAFFQVDTVLVNLTISLFTAILAVSSFVIGPVADSRGRRVTALWGLAIFIAGSLICLFAPSYAVFLAGRAVQATGISACSLVAAAVIGDIYEPHERVRAMSIYQTVIFLGPVLGPVLGGVIAAHAHWHGIFVLLVGAGLAVWLYNFIQLKETRPEGAVATGSSLSAIRRILGDRAAIALLLIGFTQFFGYYVFLVYLPELLESLFQTPVASRGFFFVPLTAGILLGINLGGRTQRYLSARRLVSWCSYAICLEVLAFSLLLMQGWMSMGLLVALLLMYGLLLGISLPVQTSMLVGLSRGDRATAVGLYNCFRFGGAALGPMMGGAIEAAVGLNAVFLALALLLAVGAWFGQAYLPGSPDTR